MVLWAYLGLTPGDMPERVPYLRVLAANGTGCRLLSRMREAAAVPVLTRRRRSGGGPGGPAPV
ncbi:MAG: hypothetical protein EP146_16790 [Oscillibacter sp.]|uniref:hypothetical protein n=1 Tax=Oscillibacter sp. TaxID=1945593 RepID=UPI001321AB7D|nr:hypothetical protein [Oscillibacter sp.]MUU12881.1 hypothetical protein [Oscillibacter sp.]